MTATLIDWVGQAMSVRGPVASEAMGVTLTHDHVMIDAWDFQRPRYDVILDDESIMLEEVQLFPRRRRRDDLATRPTSAWAATLGRCAASVKRPA